MLKTEHIVFMNAPNRISINNEDANIPGMCTKILISGYAQITLKFILFPTRSIKTRAFQEKHFLIRSEYSEQAAHYPAIYIIMMLYLNLGQVKSGQVERRPT